MCVRGVRFGEVGGVRGGQVFSVIQEEETSFSRTLQKGIKRYKAIADSLKKGAFLSNLALRL